MKNTLVIMMSVIVIALFFLFLIAMLVQQIKHIGKGVWRCVRTI